MYDFVVVVSEASRVGFVGSLMSSVAMPALSFGVMTTRTLPIASTGPALTPP